MSDSNAYVNAYIDSSIGLIHENISNILQLRTQLKMAGNAIAQKDEIINQLSSHVEELKTTNSDIKHLTEQVRVLTEQNHALSNKASHFDVMTNQVRDMKFLIQDKDTRIEQLTSEIDRLKNPESALNSKSKKTTKVSQDIRTVALSSSKVETDDF